MAACIPTMTAAGPTPVMAGAGQLDYGSGTTVNGTAVTGSLNGIPTTGVTTNAAPALPALVPAAFPTASLGSGTLTTAGPVTAGSYGTVNTTGNPTVFNGGTYYINTLNASGSIRLGPGTYYINNLNMSGSLTVTGAVQIFIGSNFNVNANNVSVNPGGNAGNLQINLYSDAQIDTNGKNNFSFTGLIYSPFANTQVQIDGNNTTITGAIITASEVQLGKNTTINYNATVQAQITALACPVAGPDHIEIDHTGSALTCSPQTVTIKACANAACTILYTAGGVNVTLTPGGQVFAIDTTGINNAATVQQSTAGTATLGVTSNPASAGAATCSNSGATATAAACTNAMTFYDSGFAVTVLNRLSCGNATATIAAVQAVPGTGKCVPAYQNVTRAVNLYTSYANPSSGTLGATASTGAVSTAAPGTAHNLAFDVNGVATITLSYPDAGQLTLTATGTAPTGAAMTGSGTFIAAPATFVFSGIPAAPLTAGQPFNVTVTALNACATPAPTPNFNGTVTLTSSNPLPGIGNAIAINTALTGFVNGVASTNLTWNEAGTIDLNASLNAYLGWTPTAPATWLVNSTQAGVGRFHPAYFETAVTPGCGTFTYAGSTTPAKAGQPFTVVVTAKAAGGGITANYAGAYAYATTLSDTGGATGLANNIIAAASFANGVSSATNVTYAAATPQTAPFILTLRATDADVPAVSSSGHVEGSTNIRSGRARLNNAHGAEIIALPVSFRTEYWFNNSWALNTADSCTGDVTLGAANAASVTLAPPAAWAAGVACVQDTGNPGLSGTGCATAGPVVQKFKKGATPGIGFAGDFNLWLKAPGAGNTGAVTVTGNVPAWLQYPWGGAGVVNPTARATFGVYKGAKEFIYLRENY